MSRKNRIISLVLMIFLLTVYSNFAFCIEQEIEPPRAIYWFNLVLRIVSLLFWLSFFFFFYIFRDKISGFFHRITDRKRILQLLKSQTLNPHDAQAHYQLGLLYRRGWKNGLAIQELEKAISIDEELVDAYYNLGELYLKKNLPEKAITALKKTLKLDPEHAHGEANLRLAQAYKQKGMINEAIKHCLKLLGMYPANVEARYNLGLFYGIKGMKKEAKQEMQEIITAVKDLPPFRYKLDKRWARRAKLYLRRARIKIE